MICLHALENPNVHRLRDIAQYAANRRWDLEATRKAHVRVSALLSAGSAVDPWDAVQLIKLLVAWDARTEAASTLAAYLRAALTPQEDSASSTVYHVEIFLLMSSALVQLIEDIDITLLAEWLLVDLSFCGGDALRAIEAICAKLTNEELDARIVAAPPRMRYRLLGIGANRGRTAARTTMLYRCIEEAIAGVITTDEVAVALQSMWSPDVAKKCSPCLVPGHGIRGLAFSPCAEYWRLWSLSYPLRTCPHLSSPHWGRQPILLDGV